MMKLSVALTLLVTLPISTWSRDFNYTPKVIGIHIGSHHFNNSVRHWNNDNKGIYFRWENGIQIGSVRNSENKQSIYIANLWERTLTEKFKVHATLGMISGYDVKPVIPLITIGITSKILGSWHVSTSVLPKPRKKGSAALHLTLEHKN